jgi:hypothetical protein
LFAMKGIGSLQDLQDDPLFRMLRGDPRFNAL